MPKGFYLKSARRTTTPARLLSFSVGYVHSDEPDDHNHQPRRFALAETRYQLRYGIKWGKIESRVFKSPAGFWKYVLGLTRQGSPLFMVSPSCYDDLCLAKMFSEFNKGSLNLTVFDDQPTGADGKTRNDREGFQGRLIAKNPPDVVHVKTATGTLRAVSLRNYTPATIADLAKNCGIILGKVHKDEPHSGIRGVRPDQAADVTHATMRTLINWWTVNQCGPWRETAAQLSLSLYKRHFCGKKLLVHRDEDCLALERDACHGGRAAVWYYGDCGTRPRSWKTHQAPPDRFPAPALPGPIYRLDVRSQYPFIFSQETFPVRLVGRWENPSLERLAAVLRYYGVIARVTIETSQAEYPHRIDRAVKYPIGRFTTALAGPELRQALADGIVRECHELAHYEMGTPFRDFANWLWEQRLQARLVKDTPAELWCKTLANAFAGKLAQKGGRWKPYPDCPDQNDWGFSWVRDRDKKKNFPTRFIAGSPQYWDKSERKNSTSPASFAYLTAYGRLMMRTLRGIAGAGNVVAQDTDCLWVTQAGYDALDRAGKIAPDSFGGLKLENVIKYIRFLSARHYYQDGAWTVAGIAEGFTALPGMKFVDVQTTNNQRHLVFTPQPLVGSKTREIDFSNLASRVGCDQDGWAVPFRIEPAAVPPGQPPPAAPAS